MTFLDKLKSKAEELDLQTKADQLAEAGAKAAHEAKVKAAKLAYENREKIDAALDKAAAAVDQRTEGKYHDKVVKAKRSVAKSVDKLAEQRPGEPPRETGPQDATTSPPWPQDAPPPPASSASPQPPASPPPSASPQPPASPPPPPPSPYDIP